MNENYYIGYSAYNDGLGISHAMNTTTEESKEAYEAWFNGYTHAMVDQRYKQLHTKSERWWQGK